MDEHEEAMGEFNMDDFLKQGGIDLEVPEEEVKDDISCAKDKPIEPAVSVYNTDPDERMCGYLVKSSVKMPGGEG